VALIPGYQFKILDDPRDFACFTWTLWYAETRQMSGRGNEQQFLMSQLAERIEEQSRLGELAPHAAPLDFKRQADRFSLARALKALQDLGGLTLQDGGTDEWVNQTGEADVLWEFTDVTRSLLLSLEPDRVQLVWEMLDGNPLTLKPALIPDAQLLDPLQRAWRTLLLGPSLYKYDDAAAFNALVEQSAQVQHELGATFGWQLDLRREYAAILRASGTSLGPLTLLNLQAAADQAALLCCSAIREKVEAGLWRPLENGCVLISQGDMSEIFRQVREKYGERWGSTARKKYTPLLRDEVYEKMRQAGFMRGPDRDGNIIILPAAARYQISYMQEEEAEPPEKTAPVAQATQAALEFEPAPKPTPKPIVYTEKLEGRYNGAEVADMFGVSNQTILNWINKGVVKAERIGNHWSISSAEVERLKQARNGENK
jgi:uncharacterized protein (TIGR02678 family)